MLIRIGNQAPRAQHRVGAGEVMSGGANISGGVVQNKILALDKVAGEPEAGAGVVKVAAGHKPVADGTCPQAFIEFCDRVFGDR